MAAVERLVDITSLKTSFLEQLAKGEVVVRPHIHYDPDFDALFLMLAPYGTETVVHYLDDHIALLYEPDSLDIVGIQVEGWEHYFLPKHDELARVWRQSDRAKEIEIKNLADLNLHAERETKFFIKEVWRASKENHGREEFPLAEDFFKVYA